MGQLHVSLDLHDSCFVLRSSCSDRAPHSITNILVSKCIINGSIFYSGITALYMERHTYSMLQVKWSNPIITWSLNFHLQLYSLNPWFTHHLCELGTEQGLENWENRKSVTWLHDKHTQHHRCRYKADSTNLRWLPKSYDSCFPIIKLYMKNVSIVPSTDAWYLHIHLENWSQSLLHSWVMA